LLRLAKPFAAHALCSHAWVKNGGKKMHIRGQEDSGRAMGEDTRRMGTDKG
jgi:hypothetical protein